MNHQLILLTLPDPCHPMLVTQRLSAQIAQYGVIGSRSSAATASQIGGNAPGLRGLPLVAVGGGGFGLQYSPGDSIM
jgi:hypothetical protein